MKKYLTYLILTTFLLAGPGCSVIVRSNPKCKENKKKVNKLRKDKNFKM